MDVDFFSKYDIKLNTLCEDSNFLVLNKPAGILVHSTKYSQENTLVDLLLKLYPEIKLVGEKGRPGIVHRLDKDVSGLMIITKTQAAYKHLVQQFKENKTKKEYLALVHGRPKQDKGIVDLPIGRTKKGKIVAVKYRKKIKLEKPAITEYEVVKEYQTFNVSLLKAKPLTGRTHQIRIHLKSIDCPIVGDKKYSIKQLNNLTIKQKLDRIFLHASYLGFYDLEDQWREFRSELPIELNNFLKRIK